MTSGTARPAAVASHPSPGAPGPSTRPPRGAVERAVAATARATACTSSPCGPSDRRRAARAALSLPASVPAAAAPPAPVTPPGGSGGAIPSTAALSASAPAPCAGFRTRAVAGCPKTRADPRRRRRRTASRLRATPRAGQLRRRVLLALIHLSTSSRPPSLPPPSPRRYPTPSIEPGDGRAGGQAWRSAHSACRRSDLRYVGHARKVQLERCAADATYRSAKKPGPREEAAWNGPASSMRNNPAVQRHVKEPRAVDDEVNLPALALRLTLGSSSTSCAVTASGSPRREPSTRAANAAGHGEGPAAAAAH